MLGAGGAIPMLLLGGWVMVTNGRPGENIFADLEARSQPVHAEEVVKRDPELILLCWAGIPFDEIDPAKARDRAGWDRITAVQTGRLHPVEEGWYGRPGPRVVLGIRQMAEWITALEENP